jgi:pyruvate formate lyase activating enzyme
MPSMTGARAGTATASFVAAAGLPAGPDGDDAPRGVVVGGVTPFTTTDFPGRLAAVLFLQGCPWRCAYCHNPHLVPPRRDPADDSREQAWDEVLAFLRSRRGLLDAVVFSGGEPTAQPGLAAAIREVRALGFAIGLHTGGAYPRRLAAVLPLVDWVGFDVKAPAGRYAGVTGVEGSGAPARESLELLRASGVACEVRTTVHPALTPAAALLELAGELESRDIRAWVLQPFRPSGCADPAVVAAAPQGAPIDPVLVASLAAFVPGVTVR